MSFWRSEAANLVVFVAVALATMWFHHSYGVGAALAFGVAVIYARLGDIYTEVKRDG